MKGDTRKSTLRARELKKLAGMIRDEAHLERILAGCRPGFQSAVKRQLRPYLSFTLAEELIDMIEPDSEPTIEEQCP